jgi:hypothetical protein
MYGNWWWNKQWVIRETGPLRAIFDEGDTLVLEPNDASDTPSFFWIRFNNKNSEKAKYWKDRYVYAVGTTTPPVALALSWDDTLPWDQQGTDVLNEYHRAVNQARSVGDNPYIAKLEGHIYVTDHYEIVRIFCFQGIQPNGHDWIAFDAMQTKASSSTAKKSGVNLLEDGTGHGDPPH